MQRAERISSLPWTVAQNRPSQPSNQANGLSAKRWGQVWIILIVIVWGASLHIGFESALAVLTALGLLAAIVGLRRPALGLLGIGVIAIVDVPAKELLFTGGIWRYNTFNYWLLFVILLSLPFLLRIRNSQMRLLQAWIVVLILGIAFSYNLREGAQRVLDVLTLLGLITYFAYNVAERATWYWLGLVCGTVSALGSVPFYLDIGQIGPINAGFWVHFPLAGLLATALGLPFALEESRGRLSLGLVALITLAGTNLVWVFISASRGALLVSLFFFVFLAMEIRGLSRRILVFILVALVALIASLQFVDLRTHAVERFQLLFEPEVALVNRTSGRSDLMVAGWRIFRGNPFGIGTSNFDTAWADLGSLGGLLTYHVGGKAGAHSAWLRTLVENGILGFVLLAAFVISFALVGWKRSGRDPTLWHLGLLVSGVLSVAFLSREFDARGLQLLAAGVMVLFHKEEIAALWALRPNEELPQITNPPLR